jgi:hypothetical protein
MAILQDQSKTNAELLAEIQKLRESNEKLRQARSRALSWKVSDKGAVSVYGLGRFPITLYYSQWVKLFSVIKDVEAFVGTCYEAGELSTKDD